MQQAGVICIPFQYYTKQNFLQKKSSKTLDSLAHLAGKKWYVLYLRENAFLYLYNIYNIAHKCTCDQVTDMLYNSKELLGQYYAKYLKLLICKIGIHIINVRSIPSFFILYFQGYIFQGPMYAIQGIFLNFVCYINLTCNITIIPRKMRLLMQKR